MVEADLPCRMIQVGNKSLAAAQAAIARIGHDRMAGIDTLDQPPQLRGHGA